MDTQTKTQANGNDELREQLATLRKDLTNLSETVQKEAKDRLGDVQERGREQLENLEGQIRRQPVTAAAIAAGVGFLIGAILSR